MTFRISILDTRIVYLDLLISTHLVMMLDDLYLSVVSQP